MRRIPVTDAPRQAMSLILNGRRCTLSLAYNVMAERWSFGLSIDGTLHLSGRRVVVGVDLLAPFGFGLGAVFAGDYEGRGELPDYDGLVTGRVRLYHVTPAEIAAEAAL